MIKNNLEWLKAQTSSHENNLHKFENSKYLKNENTFSSPSCYP